MLISRPGHPMNSTLRHLPTPAMLVAFMALIVAPSVAHADTYTVAANDPISLQSALDQAAGHVNSAGPDVVTIPAGTYSGSFTYAGDAVDIEGAGQTTTTLTAAGITTLEIDAPGSAVSGLSIVNTSGTYGYGVDLLQGGTVHDVGLHPSGTNVVGLRSTGDASLTRARVSVSSSSTGVRVSGGASMTISETTMEGAAGTSKAVQSDSAGTTVKVTRLRSVGVSFPMRALFGGALTVRDSLLVLPTDVFSTALEAGDGNNPSDRQATVDADRVTIVGDPAASQRGAFVFANTAGDDFRVSVHDSVISGVKAPLVCSALAGTGLTSADWSSLPASGDTTSGAGCTAPRTNAVAAGPIFVDAAGGDYHQRDDSPLIDAGDPAPLAATEDLDGMPRPVGRTDLGAYEYQTPAGAGPTPPGSDIAPGPAADVTPPGVTLMAQSRLSLRKVLRRGIPATIGCSEACSYAATVRLGTRSAKRLHLAGRLLVGRRNVTMPAEGSRKLTIKLTRRARRALRRHPGVTLEVRAIATDQAGNTGRARTRRVTLVR
jgi:hypothetical protein